MWAVGKLELVKLSCAGIRDFVFVECLTRNAKVNYLLDITFNSTKQISEVEANFTVFYPSN